MSSSDRTTSATTSGKSLLRNVTARVITSVLDEIGKDDIRKNMMDKLVAPSIRLLYAQLMPYLWILVALVLIMLLLVILTFCLAALLYFGRGKR